MVRPDRATMIAVTPTLDATTACTRNSGSNCSASTVKTNPSRSTVSPTK